MFALLILNFPKSVAGKKVELPKKWQRNPNETKRLEFLLN